MSQQVGSLYLELFLDPSKYYAQLEEVERRSREMAARVEKNMQIFNSGRSLRPKVDASELHNLNKLYDVKIAHHNKVRSHFERNPLRVRVDTSELDILENRLKGIKTNQSLLIDVIYKSKSSNSEAKTFAKEIGDEFEKVGDRLVKGIKKATNKGILGTIFGGFLSGLGDEVAKQFGRGLIGRTQSKTGGTLSGLGSSVVDGIGQVYSYGKSVINRPGNNANQSSNRKSQVEQLQKEIIELENAIASYKQSKSKGVPFAMPVSIKTAEAIPINIENVKKKQLEINQAVSQTLNKSINQSLDSVKKQISGNAISVDTAKADFERIKAGFKTAYASLKQSMSEGNLQLAKVQAETIQSAAKTARAEIDKIKADLKKKGVATHFGSELATMAGSTKGVIERSYSKPAGRISGEISQKQSFIKIGNDVLGGTLEGLKDYSPVTRQASRISFAILRQMKDDLGIKSPSKKSEEVFLQIIQGLAVGAVQGVKQIPSIVQPVSAKILSELKAGVPKTPQEAQEQFKNAVRKGKLLEYSARTMPQGSQENSGQRFINQVLPRNVRSQIGVGGNFLQEQVNQLIKDLPRIMQSPSIQKLLTYKMKLEVKGWSDVLELLYQDVSSFFQKVEQKAGSQKYFGEFLQNAVGGLKNLNLTAVAAGVSFFRFFSALKYLGYLTALSNAVLLTASNFEALDRRFILTSKSAVQAKQSLSQIYQSTTVLGLDRTAALEGVSSINAAMRSRVNSQQTVDNFSQSALMAARVYGVNPQDQQQILSGFAGLSQDAVLSEGSFQQLQQTVPDIYAIGARAAGVSEQGFRQGLQKGQYSSADLLPALSNQLSGELGTQMPGAMDTMNAATQRLTNSFEALQLAFSDFALPFNKFTTNTFASAVELAAKGANLLASALTGLAFYGVFKFGKSLLVLSGNLIMIAKSIPFVGTALLAMAKIAQQVALSIVPILKKMALELLVFQLVVDIFSMVSTAMKDSSGEIGKAADNIVENLGKFEKALSKTRETAKGFSQQLPKTFGDIKGKSYLEDTFFGGLLGKDVSRGIEETDIKLRKLNPIIGALSPDFKKKTRSEKELIDKGTRVDQIVDSANTTKSAINEQINSPSSELKRLAQLEKQIDSIQIKRNALAVVDPTNRKEFEKLKRDEENLVKESSNLRKPIDLLSGTQTAIIKGLQDSLLDYDRLANEGLITQEEYTKRTKQITEALNDAEAEQDKFNKQLRNALTPLQSLERAWVKINGSLESAKNNITFIANNSKQAIAQRELNSQITPGQANFSKEGVNINQLQGQVTATTNAIRQMYAELESKGGKEVFSALGVTKETGANQIQALAESSEGFPLQKVLLERLAQTKEAELNLSDLKTQLAEARSQAQKQLIDLNKQVADYYRNISRTAQQQQIELEKMANQVKTTTQQNKLRSALLDGYDTIFSQYVDSIIEQLEQYNSISNQALDAKSQKLQNKFGLEDTLRSGVELSRNLPTVPIKLDFSNIPTDSNIAAISQQVNDAVEGTTQLGEQINQSTDNVDELYKSLIQNLSPIEGANKLVEESRSLFDEAAKSVENVGDKTSAIGSNLDQVNPKITSINEGFNGLLGTVGNIVTETAKWLAGLGNAPNLFQQILGFFSGGGTNTGGEQGQQQGGLGGLIQQGVNFLTGNTGQQVVQGFSGKMGKVSWVENSASSMDSDPGHTGDDIFAPIGSKFYSPVSGTVVQSRVGGTKNTDDANPLVPGYQPQQLVILKLDMPIEFEGKKITHFNMRHLLERNVEVGQKVKMGDLIGTIGEAGGRGAQFGPKTPGTPRDADAAHLHIEYSPAENDQRNSLKDAQASKLTAILSQQFKAGVTSGKVPVGQSAIAQTQMRSPVPMQQSNNSGGILWGQAAKYAPSDLSGLTPRGRKAMEALKNPNVRKLLDAVAIAELGERDAAKGGYGYLYGDVNGKETFNPNALSTHPKQRRSKWGRTSSATGRYQTMDFVWNEEAPRLGLRDFKPQSQEIMAVSRLMYRRVLDQVMKGDFAGALNKPGDFDLASEWASIQGNPYGQGTPGGKRDVFLANASRGYGGQPVTVAANNFTSASPAQMRYGVGTGMQLATQTTQLQNNAIDAQSQAAIQANLQGAIRRGKQAEEAFARGRRDQDVQVNQQTRAVTDMKFEGITNPSPDQQRLKESTNIARERDDKLRELDETKKRIERSREQKLQVLESGAYKSAPDPVKFEKDIRESLEEDNKQIAQLNKNREEIIKASVQKQKALLEKFDYADIMNRAKQSLDISQRGVDALSQELEQLQKLKERGSNDPRIKDIPKLQEKLTVDQALLKADREKLDLSERLYKNDGSINLEEYNKQVAAINKSTIAILEAAAATREWEEAQLKLQETMRNFEARSRLNSLTNEVTQNQIAIRNAGGGGDDPLRLQKLITDSQTSDEFERRRLEIMAATDRTQEQKQAELDALKFVQSTKVNANNAEYNRNRQDNAIAATNLFNQSSLDVSQAQIGKYRSLGNDRDARALEKQVAIFQQNTAFQDKIKELERLAATNDEVAQSADLIRANYERLNQLKLDEINDQFNDFLPAIQELKGATQGFISDLLKGGDAFGNLFNKVFDTITNLASELLTRDIFGGLFGGGKSKTPSFGGFDMGSIFGGDSLLGSLFGGIFDKGGYVPNYARGYNPLADALSRERQATGRKAYVAVLSQGERVLNYDETRKFNQLGGDRILRMANGGTVGEINNNVMSSIGGNTNVNVSVIVPSDTGGKPNADKLGASLKSAIISTIINEKRPGGALYNG